MDVERERVMERVRERGGRERETEGESGKERVRKGGRRELITLLNGSIVIYKSLKFKFFLNELDKIIRLVKFFEIM